MNQQITFHGSDLEQIEKIYHIPAEEIVCFGANVNPLGFPQKASKAVCSRFSKLLEHYPDREYTALRGAISGYCHIPADYVIVGNGSTELISLLIRSRNIRRAVQIGPSYSEYGRELSLAGISCSTYLLRKENLFHPDILEAADALKKEKARLLILCNPNNPTASAFSTQELEVLLEECRKAGIFVMIDETYAEFASGSVSAMPLIPRFENLMIIRGISKFFAAPGLRLGYGACSDPAFLSHLKKTQNPWSVNSIAAFAGECLFSDYAFIAKTRQLISSERQRMAEAFSRIPGLTIYPSDTNFLLAEITVSGTASSDLFDYLIRKRLMVRDCSSFDGLNGEFFRFCLMNPEDNTRLLEAVREFFIR